MCGELPHGKYDTIQLYLCTIQKKAPNQGGKHSGNQALLTTLKGIQAMNT